MQGRIEAVVSGKVQGVGFRAFAEVEAIMLGLRGYVKNLPDGSVEIVAEGEDKKLTEFLGRLRIGNPLARVGKITERKCLAKGEFTSFSVHF